MKNKIKFLSALFVMLGIVCVFTSCPWDEKPSVNYTITYVSDYGTTPDPIKVLSGAVLNESQLPVLKEEGYTFLGWYENDAKVIAGSYSVYYNVTLTAKWKKMENPTPEPEEVKYTVTFKTEYGKVPAALEVLEDTKLTKTDLKALTYAGYTFEGWYDEDDKLVEAGKFIVTKDVTLTAKWKKAASADDDPDDDTTTDDDDDDNKGSDGDSGDEDDNKDQNPPAEVKYTVTFKTEYGKAPTALEILENTKLTETNLKALTYAGYTFEGWYDEDDELVEAEKFIVTKDVTLTAKWKKAASADDDSDDDTTTDEDDDKEVVKGSVNFTFEVKDFADFEIIATEVTNADNPDSKDITLSVAEKYDSYSWTIITRSSTSTKTKKTVTLTEADYKYGADIILVVQDGDNYYSAQYSIEVKESK